MLPLNTDFDIVNRAEDAAKVKIAVIGLGYVGLPLAIEFAKKYTVLGFDINKERVEQLIQGIDLTLEADIDDLKQVIHSDSTGEALAWLKLSSQKEELSTCNIYIITVATPINRFKSPDLSHLLNASEMIGSVLKKGDYVIYESTVYPGCTEEECIPLLERESGLECNLDFTVGYSPERISPGDKLNKLTTIKKVTSGSNPAGAEFVDQLYRSIIKAGTYKASNIQVAEAAKAIENAQRDINISFVNELALIFDRMGIDTNDVLEAAATKWNFLKFKPGLVGGHCIGVDPYYLAFKAQSLGYHPQVILSGRRVNDQMGAFVANKVVKLMINKGLKIKGGKALILGITFKEDCPDIRNTRVIDIYDELASFGLDVDIYDPWANINEVKNQYKIDVLSKLNDKTAYDALIVAVAHTEFLNLDYKTLKTDCGVIYDTKAFLDRSIVDGRL